MISQFVEIPEDMIFTEEYSVRAARIAVYTLFDVSDKILYSFMEKRQLQQLYKLAFNFIYMLSIKTFSLGSVSHK
jgi:oleate hydratase